MGKMAWRGYREGELEPGYVTDGMGRGSRARKMSGEENWRVGNPETFSGCVSLTAACGDAGPCSLLPKYFLMRPHSPVGQSMSLTFIHLGRRDLQDFA